MEAKIHACSIENTSFLYFIKYFAFFNFYNGEAKKTVER